MKLSSYTISFSITKGPLKSQALTFTSLPIFFGRKHTNIILEEAKVSTRHASITLEHDKLVLKDLKSKNGTFLNGKKISSAKLKPQDLIQIGKSEFEISWKIEMKELKKTDAIEEFAKKPFPKGTPESVIEEIFLNELKQK